MVNEGKKREFKISNYLLGALILTGFLVLIISFTQAISEIESISSGEELTPRVLNSTSDILSKGKNIVVFDDYINAGELVKKNSQIETISYYDSFNDESVGYINLFGGLGRDFLIIPGKEYEIFVKASINLNI